jgi:excisionase family DNA binding protein
MEDLKHFLSFVQLFLNRGAKPIVFQWLDEYFRNRHLLLDNSNALDPLTLLDSSDVCKLLKCNRHYLYELVDANKVKVIRKGNALRFRRKDVQDYIEREFGG